MTRIGLVLLVVVACKKEEPPPVETDTPPPPPPTELTTIGTPMWHLAELTLFTAPDSMDTETCLLDGNHAFDGTFWGPGTPHEPPYDTEMADAVERCGYRVDTTFAASEFTNGNGIWLAATFIPNAGNAPGSSADFPLGDVIYADRFPVVIDGDLRREESLVDIENDANYPGPERWDPMVSGTSHFIWLFRSSNERMPLGARPNGAYTWEIVLRDAKSVIEDQGYDLTYEFIVEEPLTSTATE